MSDLDDDYATAGFGGHLPFGARPALLIFDVCRAYLDDNPLGDFDDALCPERHEIVVTK